MEVFGILQLMDGENGNGMDLNH